MYYVYVLKSKKDHDLYLGSTNDLKKRFKKHNDGKVFSTKSRIPFELIYCEVYKSEKDARIRESKLKKRKNTLFHLKNRIKESLK
jgi:putative endonuclease